MLCAKLTVQHTDDMTPGRLGAWDWGLVSGDHWPAPMGGHERRSTAFQKAFPQNIRLCVTQ